MAIKNMYCNRRNCLFFAKLIMCSICMVISTFCVLMCVVINILNYWFRVIVKSTVRVLKVVSVGLMERNEI